MKTLFISILVLFAIFPYKRATKIDGVFNYEQIENRNQGFSKHITFYKLIVNNTFSTYSQQYSEQLDQNYTEDDGDGVSNITVVKPKENEMKSVHNDFKTSQMYFTDMIAFDMVNVKEDKFNMSWVLSDEQRVYGKRICNKATTTFRGRTYVAWYCKDLQLNIGPWKFINTPGLIFEIYDTNKILHVKLNDFTTKKISNVNNWQNKKLGEIINLKQYIALKSKSEDVILAKLNSRLPQGSKPFVKNKEQKDIELFTY